MPKTYRVIALRRRRIKIVLGAIAALVLIGFGTTALYNNLADGAAQSRVNPDMPPTESVSEYMQQSPASGTSPQTPDPRLDDWRLLLVNEENPLPKNHSIETKALPNGKEFDARAFDALTALLEAGNSSGLDLMVCSGYRTIEKQTNLFEEEMAKYENQGYSYEEAYDAAKTTVAVPGTSEHNLGLAADICAVDHQTLDSDFADTPEGKWLKKNAAQFGFIQRYPDGKQDVTGIIFEPWHYRYVGKENAEEINRLGMCLEEYIEYLQGPLS